MEKAVQGTNSHSEGTFDSLITRMRQILSKPSVLPQYHTRSIIRNLTVQPVAKCLNGVATKGFKNLISQIIATDISSKNDGLSPTLVKLSNKSINQRFQGMKQTLSLHPEDRACIEKWVGQLIRIASQEAYEAYSQDVEESQVRLAFAGLILEEYRKCIIQASKMNCIKVAEMQQIFNGSCNQTIQFLQYKYPSAKNKVADMSLGEKIKQTNKTIDSSYDLLRRSGTDLPLHSEELLRREIKHFLNKVIDETDSTYGTFKDAMLGILTSETTKFQPDISFQIGAKVRQTTKTYKQEEVGAPGFFVKGNEIMRIMMKWIEELLEFFRQPSKTKDNRGGFKILFQDEMKKIGFKERERMWQMFSKSNRKLTVQLEELQEGIRRTISNIILVSENEIANVEFLDRDVISMLIICQYIWKTLQNYMMDVLVTILGGFYNIRKQYEASESMEADLQICTFTLGDLFRCKCSGTKEQILQVYERLERHPDLQIVRVKNRLNQVTSDFLINFVFKDKAKCFFICEMQIALCTTKANQDKNYHFGHFLYQQARSPHGAVIQLGVMLYSLDNRKDYLNKHALVFKSQSQKFRHGQDIDCIECKQVTVGNNKTKSYMCCNCCKLIQGFKFYFDGKKCPSCLNYICPLCYLKVYDKQRGFQEVLKGFPRLKGYFRPIKQLYLNQSPVRIQEDIQQYFAGNKYLGILHFKSHRGKYQFHIIKRFVDQMSNISQVDTKRDKLMRRKRSVSDVNLFEEKVEQTQFLHTAYYLKAFTNQTFHLQESLQNSIVILLTPQSDLDTIPMKEYLQYLEQIRQSRVAISTKVGCESINPQTYKSKFQCIVPRIHDDFRAEGQSQHLFLIRNPDTQREFIIDYCIEDEHSLRKHVSDSKVSSQVNRLNKSKQKSKKLVLDKFAVNFSLLQRIKDKEAIRELQISRAYEYSTQGQEEFQFLNQFSNISSLAIYSTSCYQTLQKYTFDQNLQQLIISDCLLAQIMPKQYPSLVKLELCNDGLSQLSQIHLPKLEYLNLSKNSIRCIEKINQQGLQCLTKLVIKQNDIVGPLPILNLPSLRILNLSRNRLNSIGNLSQFNTPRLKSIFLSHNRISGSVPHFELKQLHTLDVSFNHLDSMQLRCHPNITNIDLSSNLIQEVPLFQIPKLKTLNVSSNKISGMDNVKDIIQHLNVEKLQLFDNPFECLPFVRTQVSRIRIEPSKVRFEIDFQDLEQYRGNHKCYCCNKEIKGAIMSHQIRPVADFCKDCVNISCEKVIEIIELTTQSINRYA